MPWLPFAHLTSRTIRQADLSRVVVLLPVYAVEQHGRHLPVGTDVLLGQALLERALAEADTAVQFWVLPPLSYGLSTEHLGFPGTVSLRPSTLLSLLEDVGSSLKEMGFRVLAVVNSHGGNDQLLEVAARQLRSRGLRVFCLHLMRECERLEVASGLPDVHAGEVETSLVLSLYPHLVAREQIPGESQLSAQAERILAPERGVSPAWIISDLGPDGVAGDPSRASAERGEAYLAHLVGVLAAGLRYVATMVEEDTGVS